MADLDIVVKLDPGQPVAGAKAVTAELAKTEDQAKKTEDAAKGIAKLNFKQAAAGAAQAFELLNSKLKITDSEFGAVVGSAVKFGALGAQMAGPWGAAAGAVVGALVEIDGVMDDVTESAHALIDASKTADERIAELTKGVSSLGGQFRALTSGAHSMTEAISLVTTHLQRLHDATGTFSSLGPVLKQVNDQLDAQKRILGSVNDPRTNFVRDMTALDLLFKNGAISAVDFVRQQSAMATGFATQEGVVVKATAALEKHLDVLDLLRSASGPVPVNQNSQAEEWKRELQRREQQRAIDEAMSQRRGLAGGADDTRFAINSGASKAQIAEAAALAEYTKQTAEETKKQADEAERAQAAIGSMSEVMAGELVNSAKSFSDSLVDAAQGANVSWSSTFEGIADGLARAITQALILKALTGSYTGAAGANGAAIGGLFGALGFASGGTIYPSGTGSQDTQSVAFRKRPDETVHINTPQQERAYQRGGQGGATTVQVVYSGDPRALMQGGADVQRVVLDSVRANPGAFRALLGR